MMNIDIKKQTRVIKENLFSSPVSTLLTFITSYIMISFFRGMFGFATAPDKDCLLYTSPSPRDNLPSRMPSSA